MRNPTAKANVLAPVFAGMFAFAAYALLCPTVSGMGDGSEFTLVLATNGVPHPTGYPLYTLFGHAFGTLLHAVGVSWPLAANLWSATGAAIAVGFLFALAHRLTQAVPAADAATRLLAALVPVALFALQPVLLIDATAGEVNAWSAAWVSIAAYVFVRLQSGLESLADDGAMRDRRGAALWGLVCGAGMAHHLTSVLVSAPLTVALAVTLLRGRRAALPLALMCMLGACLPLAGYAIIAWRAWNPGLVQWPGLAPSLASVWDHMTGAQYRHYIGYFAPADDHRALIDGIVLPFLGVGLIALGAGIIRAWGTDERTQWVALTIAAILVVAFTSRYGVADPAPYFLPAMAIAAAAVAPALAMVVAPRVRGAALRLGLAVLLATGLAAPWVEQAVGRGRDIDRYEKLIRSMWSAVPPDTAIVFWPDDRYLRLREYQLLRDEKPALLVLNPHLLLEDQTRARLRQRFGVDPLEDHPVPAIEPGDPAEELRIRQYFKVLIRDFNARIRTPVIIFDPSIPLVQQLRKPWERGLPQGDAPMPSGPVPAH
jgi:hypothetical protein